MSSVKPAPNTYLHYLEDGGEMGELTRCYDWSKSVLGSPENWPQSLLTTVGIVLKSKFPMFLWWGGELIQFYNDAYRPSLGNGGKHPEALGQPAADCWPEIWPVIKPLIDQVMSGGESVWSKDQLIPIYRNGQMEDVYWTFGYSRVNNEDGKAGGVLVICNETTNEVKTYQEIVQTKNELEFAIEAAELGTWDLNPATNKFIGNDTLKTWFGLPTDAEIELHSAIEVILDADRQRVTNAIEKAMDYQTGGSYDISYTIINPLNPAPRMVRAKGKALFNDNKQAIRFSGILQDITQEKMAAQKVEESNIRLERAYEQTSLSKQAAQLGTFDMDLENGTLEWDERCRLLFGISHKDTVSYERDFVNGLHPEDRKRILEEIEKVFIKSVSNGNYDVEYRTVGAEDQVLRWVKARGKAYFNNNDKPTRFIGSVLDITEQKLNELRKNDFIAMVSHELKTPLTSLKAYVQLLIPRLRKNGDDFTVEILGKSDLQIKKMTEMINGFLNISRLDAGKIHLDKTDFLLNDLIKECLENFALTVSTHHLYFLPYEELRVNADYEKVGQVINNLLSNAVKYSPRGKLIEISCRQEGKMAIVSVKDEGMGIKPQDIGKLFERFYRVESKHTLAISGFGIGLYLCSEIIQIHEGKIWIESEKGKGSTFYFSLPLAN